MSFDAAQRECVPQRCNSSVQPDLYNIRRKFVSLRHLATAPIEIACPDGCEDGSHPPAGKQQRQSRGCASSITIQIRDLLRLEAPFVHPPEPSRSPVFCLDSTVIRLRAQRTVPHPSLSHTGYLPPAANGQ